MTNRDNSHLFKGCTDITWWEWSKEVVQRLRWHDNSGGPQGMDKDNSQLFRGCTDMTTWERSNVVVQRLHRHDNKRCPNPKELRDNKLTEVVINVIVVKSATGLGYFIDLPFYWRESVSDFVEVRGIRSLRFFSKPSAINGFELPLPTTVWVGLVMLFPSVWWVVENIFWT